MTTVLVVVGVLLVKWTVLAVVVGVPLGHVIRRGQS